MWLEQISKYQCIRLPERKDGSINEAIFIRLHEFHFGIFAHEIDGSFICLQS
jgi:hypothetical protein